MEPGHPITLEVSNRAFGVVTVRGFTTVTAGLAVLGPYTEYGDEPDEWSLIHIRSGLTVWHCHSPEVAAAAAVAVADLADWTLPAAAILLSVGFYGDAVEAACAHLTGAVHGDEHDSPLRRERLPL